MIKMKDEVKWKKSSLQGLQSDVSKNTQKYDRCLALGSQLMQVCETPAKQDIQKALTELQSRFVLLNSQCIVIYNIFKTP